MMTSRDMPRSYLTERMQDFKQQTNLGYPRVFTLCLHARHIREREEPWMMGGALTPPLVITVSVLCLLH